MRPIL
jgi:hypothetical protein